jgi:hypothetical protein
LPADDEPAAIRPQAQSRITGAKAPVAEEPLAAAATPPSPPINQPLAVTAPSGSGTRLSARTSIANAPGEIGVGQTAASALSTEAAARDEAGSEVEVADAVPAVVEVPVLDVVVRVPTGGSLGARQLLAVWVRDVGGVIHEPAEQDTEGSSVSPLRFDLPVARWADLLDLLRGREAREAQDEAHDAAAVDVRWQAPRRGARVVMLEALHAMGVAAPPRQSRPLRVRVDFVMTDETPDETPDETRDEPRDETPDKKLDTPRDAADVP